MFATLIGTNRTQGNDRAPFVATTTSPPANPFRAPAVSRFLASRTNDVTAALCDLRTGRIYTYNPDVPMPTASMVKIDILAALLHHAELSNLSLTPVDRQLAVAMVEDSDNNAATTLFNELGGPATLKSFNQTLGMAHTTTQWNWGATLTTPYDELALLRTIVLPNNVLNEADRRYEMSLMEHVVNSQRFGVGQGAPASALVGLKNGWFPYDSGWGINSAGFVLMGNTEYLIALQTANNPNEAYGRDTVSHLATLLWRAQWAASSRPPAP